MLSDETKEILNNVIKLLEKQSIQVVTKQSVKSGIISGVCSIAGGFLGGRVGVIVGGLAGSAINSYLTPEFVPLIHIIQNEMSDEQKTNLVQLIKTILQVAPVPIAVSNIMSNNHIKDTIISTVLNFIKNKQGYDYIRL